jgi:hypothetical protein
LQEGKKAVHCFAVSYETWLTTFFSSIVLLKFFCVKDVIF